VEQWKRDALAFARRAGVAGDDRHLIESVKQSACWLQDDQAAAYLGFAERFWPQLLTPVNRAEAVA
jgi:hypothetical protein